MGSTWKHHKYFLFIIQILKRLERVLEKHSGALLSSCNDFRISLFGKAMYRAQIPEILN